uniref:Uncharacterized protein n=1 Tax=Globodera rostochiensis TaxID=31243 RepID=A0A914HRD0_GLORO
MDNANPLEMVIPQHLEPTVVLNENINIAEATEKDHCFCDSECFEYARKIITLSPGPIYCRPTTTMTMVMMMMIEDEGKTMKKKIED